MTRKDTFYGGFIDAPGPFEPVEVWERYLAMILEMDFAPDAIPSKASLIQHAREHIALIKDFERTHGGPDAEA